MTPRDIDNHLDKVLSAPTREAQRSAMSEAMAAGGITVTPEMVNAAWNKGKDLRMTGLPTNFRQVLEAALQAHQSGWLPVDTAPEDQHVILATTGGHVGEAIMLRDEDTGQQKWAWALGPVHAGHVPLGWRPLPPPPAEGE